MKKSIIKPTLLLLLILILSPYSNIAAVSDSIFISYNHSAEYTLEAMGEVDKYSFTGQVGGCHPDYYSYYYFIMLGLIKITKDTKRFFNRPGVDFQHKVN